MIGILIAGWIMHKTGLSFAGPWNKRLRMCCSCDSDVLLEVPF